ncbi:hypothetical protein GGF50DRAFT_109574 [Schizophyllum commune]
MLGVERSLTPRTPMKWKDWAEQKLQTKYDEAWRELSADHRKTLATLERADLSAHEIKRKQQNEIELFRQRERQMIWGAQQEWDKWIRDRYAMCMYKPVFEGRAKPVSEMEASGELLGPLAERTHMVSEAGVLADDDYATFNERVWRNYRGVPDEPNTSVSNVWWSPPADTACSPSPGSGSSSEVEGELRRDIEKPEPSRERPLWMRAMCERRAEWPHSSPSPLPPPPPPRIDAEIRSMSSSEWESSSDESNTETNSDSDNGDSRFSVGQSQIFHRSRTYEALGGPSYTIADLPCGYLRKRERGPVADTHKESGVVHHWSSDDDSSSSEEHFIHPSSRPNSEEQTCGIARGRCDCETSLPAPGRASGVRIIQPPPRTSSLWASRSLWEAQSDVELRYGGAALNSQSTSLASMSRMDLPDNQFSTVYAQQVDAWQTYGKFGASSTSGGPQNMTARERRAHGLYTLAPVRGPPPDEPLPNAPQATRRSRGIPGPTGPRSRHASNPLAKLGASIAHAFASSSRSRDLRAQELGSSSGRHAGALGTGEISPSSKNPAARVVDDLSSGFPVHRASAPVNPSSAAAAFSVPRERERSRSFHVGYRTDVGSEPPKVHHAPMPPSLPSIAGAFLGNGGTLPPPPIVNSTASPSGDPLPPYSNEVLELPPPYEERWAGMVANGDATPVTRGSGARAIRDSIVEMTEAAQRPASLLQEIDGYVNAMVLATSTSSPGLRFATALDRETFNMGQRWWSKFWEADQASRRLAQLTREGFYEEALQQRLILRRAMAEEKVLVGKFERQFASWNRAREEAHDSRTM